MTYGERSSSLTKKVLGKHLQTFASVLVRFENFNPSDKIYSLQHSFIIVGNEHLSIYSLLRVVMISSSHERQLN